MKRSRSMQLMAIATLALAGTAAACGNEAAEELDLSAAGTAGQLRAREAGCQSCHVTSGDGGSAPSWDGLYGSTITLSDDTEITVDEDYIITSVREPNLQKRKGQGGAMGAYDEKRISDDDLADIVQFIKELG